MLQTVIEQITLFLTGFIANILASLSGGGAGFVQLPVLIFLGLGFTEALGTHKVAVVALGLGSYARNHELKSINRTIAAEMIFIGCPAVALGSCLVTLVADWIAELILGIITIASVIYSIRRKNFGLENHEAELTRRDYALGGILVALTGMLSGSFSSGAGLIGIMVLVMWFKQDIKKAIHHSMIFIALLWNFIGAFTLGTVAVIHWVWVPMLTLGAFLGGFAGTMIIKKVNAALIKKLFQNIMILSGVLLLWKSWEHF